MKLRGIDFGPVFCASGTQGFFGEGYWYHKFLRSLGLNFDGCTFVAKTTTFLPEQGNMPIKKDGIMPREWFPRCVRVYPFKGVVLNSVGLSGPGAKALMKDGRWQKRTKPFFLSFMSVAPSIPLRLLCLKTFVEILKKELPAFQTSVGLQINYSCPNVGLDLENLIEEVGRGLDAASILNIPLMPKFNVALPIETAKKISEHPACDCLCISNTIPYGQDDRIDWEGLFGKSGSPLAHLGGGGLSGKLLLPFVIDWVRRARKAGITKPINAGGGILCPDDVNLLYAAGASSVFIGSIAMLRPWRVWKTSQRAHKLFRKEC